MTTTLYEHTDDDGDTFSIEGCDDGGFLSDDTACLGCAGTGKAKDVAPEPPAAPLEPAAAKSQHRPLNPYHWASSDPVEQDRWATMRGHARKRLHGMEAEALEAALTETELRAPAADAPLGAGPSTAQRHELTEAAMAYARATDEMSTGPGEETARDMLTAFRRLEEAARKYATATPPPQGEADSERIVRLISTVLARDEEIESLRRERSRLQAWIEMAALGVAMETPPGVEAIVRRVLAPAGAPQGEAGPHGECRWPRVWAERNADRDREGAGPLYCFDDGDGNAVIANDLTEAVREAFGAQGEAAGPPTGLPCPTCQDANGDGPDTSAMSEPAACTCPWPEDAARTSHLLACPLSGMRWDDDEQDPPGSSEVGIRPQGGPST
jgi:hypothetical protein